MSRKPAKPASKTLSVKHATLDLLRSFGIKKVFGNPGSTELPFLADWPDDIDYVLGLQEASVVGMADGYAQATRNAGFVNLHSAAGVGNALGNIYTAHRNQTPLLITAGQQARSILPLQAFLYAERASEFRSSRRGPKTCPPRSRVPITWRCSRPAARPLFRCRLTTGTIRPSRSRRATSAASSDRTPARCKRSPVRSRQASAPPSSSVPASIAPKPST